MANVFSSLTALVPKANEILGQHTTILQFSRNVSQYYTKGKDSVSFPKFAALTISHEAFGEATAAQDVSTTLHKIPVTKDLRGVIDLNDSAEFQNILETEEAALESIVVGMGIKASNLLVAALIAGAHVSNNVTKAATGNLLSDNVIDMSSKVKSRGIAGKCYALLTVSDLNSLRKELKNALRFDNDVTGIVGRYSGVFIIESDDIAPSVLTSSIVFSEYASAYAFGKDYSKKAQDPTTGDEKTGWFLPYACGVLNEGIQISKLVDAAPGGEG